MSFLDEQVVFRIANLIDANRIREFICGQIGGDHIYAKNKDFFLYEFCNEGQLNVIVAEEKLNRHLLGFYAYYIYSCNNNEFDMAGGISKVSDCCKIPLVGTMLYEKLKEYYKVRSIVSSGMNRNTSYEINRRRKDTYLGSLSHFYILSERADYKIASIRNNTIDMISEKEQLNLRLFDNSDNMYSVFDDERFIDRLPYKDRNYVEHRYFNHPIYRYVMYGVGKDLVLVCREVKANGSTILRIVDLLGDVTKFRHTGQALRNLMYDKDYEYIDFMEFGMDEKDVLAAGFTKLDLNGPNIIPNYFEPFVQKNIEVLCCASLRPALIFKADADQDRPSLIQ